MTTRAARWATVQVGRHGRAVSEVAADLGCDWHTVMDAVVVFGEVLVNDPARYGLVTAVGLDETLFVRAGDYRRQLWSTQIVDVQHGQLLDVLAGKEVTTCCAWFADRPVPWRSAVRWATLDLSSAYRMVFDTVLPTLFGLLTRITLCSSPTGRWMSAGDGCRTRPSVTADTETMRSTGPAAGS